MTQSNLNEELITVVKPADGFERHVLWCCRAPEYQLRKWLFKVLSRAGFRIIQDNYKTERASKNPRYNNVHNMVAIRGENPEIGLVSHTDVCREHTEKQRSSVFSESFEEYSKWIGKNISEDEFNKMKEEYLTKVPHRVDPVVKVISKNGSTHRVIQDHHCKIQVGGDDRLGVAIITWIALNTGYDMMLYFPTDEEIGLKSARACEIPELKEPELFVQVDRGNQSNQLVTKIGTEVLCSYEIATRLLDVAHRMGKMRSMVVGMHTDIYALKSRGWVKNAVNMTCGYHESHGAGAEEYILLEEAVDTLHYVSNIVKDYSLNGRTHQ